ncbi:unnamed protein product, partial [Allacma fusca]
MSSCRRKILGMESKINSVLVLNDFLRRQTRRMSQEVHMAGTAEGRSMAMAIRDLWRSYGLSVRVEQHKALLT